MSYTKAKNGYDGIEYNAKYLIERNDTFFYTCYIEAKKNIAIQIERGYFCEKIVTLHGIVVHTYRRDRND